MDMKPTRKQTEAGPIPADWEVSSFLSGVEKYIDYRGRTPKKLGMDWGGGNILALSANNVQMGGIDRNKESYFGSERLYKKWMSKGDCELGDILLTMEAPLGNVAQVPDSEKYILSQRVLLIKPKEWLLRSYLAHLMRGEYFQKQLRLNASGTTAQGIQRKKLDDIAICFPAETSEQEAIAEALSDADALIESLEQLLAKKRQIKQGAMQELLTGKKRLPGFTGKWETRKIGDFTDCTAGGTPSTSIAAYWGGDIRWMNSGELNLKEVAEVEGRITEEGLRSSSTKLIPPLCVLIGLAGQGKTRGTVAMNLVPLCTNQSIAAIFPNEEFSPKYLYYNLDFRYDELRELSAGDGGRGGLNLTIIRQILIPFPKLKEQMAIASLLSDMDAEISALKAKVAKVRQIKQGMTQDLLTGRIRLIKPESNVAKLPVKEKSATVLNQSHNWQINEAVIIGVFAKHFGSEAFPLGRMRCTKLTYLLHRHVEQSTEGYLKKAAGPYNPKTKYAGPEGIAQKNGYIKKHRHGTYEGWIAADSIGEAETYFDKWYGPDTLKWLEQFRRRTNDQLELLATVDMAMEDLRRESKAIDPGSVKDIIRSHPEWKKKLEREIFSDAHIAGAIEECRALFPN